MKNVNPISISALCSLGLVELNAFIEEENEVRPLNESLYDDELYLERHQLQQEELEREYLAFNLD